MWEWFLGLCVGCALSTALDFCLEKCIIIRNLTKRRKNEFHQNLEILKNLISLIESDRLYITRSYPDDKVLNLIERSIEDLKLEYKNFSKLDITDAFLVHELIYETYQKKDICLVVEWAKALTIAIHVAKHPHIA